jgi:hypothetical protein
MNDTTLAAIKNMPRDKKRMAILRLLMDNSSSHIQMFQKIKGLVNKDISRLEHIQDIIGLLRDYVKVGDVEKKKYGEVMTPLELVKDMLSTLPKEIWSNPNIKILDPANGNGIFPMVAIHALMKGLSEWEPNEERRYRHIVENVIYACELQPKNTFLYLCAIDPFDQYDVNVYTGSFLDEGFDYHMKNVWGLDKFDIIMSNAPYQEKKDGNKKAHSLWNLFVLKSIEILNDFGYLVKVHPSGWRDIDGMYKSVQEALLNMDIIYLNMNDVKEGQKVFGASTNFDFYCVRNSKKGVSTKIIDTKGEVNHINLTGMDFIPNCHFDLVLPLLAKEDEDRCKVLYNCEYHHQYNHMSKNLSVEYNLPCVYSILKSGVTNLYYSSLKKGHFGLPKAIFANGANPTYMIDSCGNFGMTEFAFAVYGYGLSVIEKSLKSKKIQDLREATKYVSTQGSPLLNRKIISTFREDFWKEFIDEN